MEVDCSRSAGHILGHLIQLICWIRVVPMYFLFIDLTMFVFITLIELFFIAFIDFVFIAFMLFVYIAFI